MNNVYYFQWKKFTFTKLINNAYTWRDDYGNETTIHLNLSGINLKSPNLLFQLYITYD